MRVCVYVYAYMRGCVDACMCGWESQTRRGMEYKQAKGELASVLSRGLKVEGGEMGDGKKGKGKARCQDKEALYRVVCCCVMLWAKESLCGPFRHMGE